MTSKKFIGKKDEGKYSSLITIGHSKIIDEKKYTNPYDKITEEIKINVFPAGVLGIIKGYVFKSDNEPVDMNTSSYSFENLIYLYQERTLKLESVVYKNLFLSYISSISENRILIKVKGKLIKRLKGAMEYFYLISDNKNTILEANTQNLNRAIKSINPELKILGSSEASGNIKNLKHWRVHILKDKVKDYTFDAENVYILHIFGTSVDYLKIFLDSVEIQNKSV